MTGRKLKLVKVDPWLEPSEKDIEERYERYLARAKTIEKDFGSLQQIADGYKYLLPCIEFLCAVIAVRNAGGAEATDKNSPQNGAGRHS